MYTTQSLKNTATNACNSCYTHPDVLAGTVGGARILSAGVSESALAFDGQPAATYVSLTTTTTLAAISTFHLHNEQSGEDNWGRFSHIRGVYQHDITLQVRF